MAFGKFGKYYPGGTDVRPETFDLIAALRGDVETVRAAEGASHVICFESPVQACEVRSDRLHVHYILMNLLLNAVKYSPAWSVIEVRTALDTRGVEFSVADRGIGVPADDLAHLFSPFFRASNVAERPGTGMGLAIVKRSAQLIGAQVRAGPREGGGTLFVISMGCSSLSPAAW